MYAGRITLNKGIAYLIESFKKVKIKNKRLKMYGILSQDVKEYLRNIELSDDIEISPPVKSRDLKYIYSKSDVLVQPSLFDGWSMVVNEALACGCPVITTLNTGASDIIKDGINGFLINIKDSYQLADKMYNLSIDKKLRKWMGDESFKIVSEQFSIDIVIKKTLKVYNLT